MQNHSRLLIPPVLVVLMLACGEVAVTPPRSEVVVEHRTTLPADVDDPTWEQTVDFIAPLLPQDVVDPRLMVPSTSEIHIQALSDGSQLAFRLMWVDDTDNNLPGAARFSDACAIQLPSIINPSVPNPQMGETDNPVEISYWRASWQATVNGRGDTIQDLYPNAWVDHYPFEAASLEPDSDEQREMALRYAPARALENPMEGNRQRSVEDLIAAGPGSLMRAETMQSDGNGQRTEEGWEVLITRPLPDGLAPSGRTVVAFAVWEGSQEEVGSRKMRTAWIPLSVENLP